MLSDRYGIPASKLVLAPFFAPPSPFDPDAAAGAAAAAGVPAATAAPPFEHRKHFLMIGNWRHPPNLDSARWACAEIWPTLRQSLPPEHRDAELHLYGAYAAGAAQQLHKPVSGVHHGQDTGGVSVRSAAASGSPLWVRTTGSRLFTAAFTYSRLPVSLLQKAGVHLKGFAPSLDVMLQYRVLLAPLRYGAGLKGKVRHFVC